MEILSFDPNMAPAGKAVIKIPLEASYEFWKSLRTRGEEAYRAAKEELAGLVLQLLEARLPGLADFFMVGQWASAMIGLNTVASAGRRLVRSLCRRDGRHFVTHEPG